MSGNQREELVCAAKPTARLHHNQHTLLTNPALLAQMCADVSPGQHSGHWQPKSNVVTLCQQLCAINVDNTHVRIRVTQDGAQWVNRGTLATLSHTGQVWGQRGRVETNIIS